MLGGKVNISVHKDIGYDIMQCLYESFPNSKLVNINEYGCYQKLFLANGCSIHYTKWRDGTMPFYIILYNQKGKYIFELDLSMLLYESEIFQWHLKKPQNKNTLSVLQNVLGEQLALPDGYVSLIRTQKSVLNSGVNTPKNGFHFLFQVRWSELVSNLTELVVSVFKGHNIRTTYVTSEDNEGENDNEDFETQRKRVRRGQRKLRLRLLELYDCKCAITGYAPTEVLEAAHIVSHAISGVNHSENGLLLRADIHSLFDSNLLRINPETFKIFIEPSLETTPYWTLNGQTLRKRVDGSHPSKEFLEQRWYGEMAHK